MCAASTSTWIGLPGFATKSNSLLGQRALAAGNSRWALRGQGNFTRHLTRWRGDIKKLRAMVVRPEGTSGIVSIRCREVMIPAP